MNVLGLRSAYLWQLMVTKSRLSPFANTKMQQGNNNNNDTVPFRLASSGVTHKAKRFERLLSLINTSAAPRTALLPVKKLRSSLLLNYQLRKTLYGFIVFEVSWMNVRGINYINELQADTVMAVEAKLMRRWEFDSIAQAAFCVSSWFTGTPHELLLLKDYLDIASGEMYYDAPEDLLESRSSEDGLNDGLSSHGFHDVFRSYPTAEENNTSSCTLHSHEGPYKRRKLTESSSIESGIDAYSGKFDSNMYGSDNRMDSFSGTDFNGAEAMEYRDILILFRFNDRDLPFKLRQIIMADLRLLRLLESGLPSWVIFLQSYPVFSHIYRPWMCPLARSLYVLISIVTVLIGFYDLYKNVPVLKATVSRLFGPLFDWIETWEMISRIRYLGTMLFLHNIERAIQWLLVIARTVRSFLAVLTQPMLQPLLEILSHLLPFWNACTEVADNLYSLVLVITISILDLAGSLTTTLLWPVQFMLSLIRSFSTSIIYPIFSLLWDVLHAVMRLLVGIFNVISSILTCLYCFLGDIWATVSRLFRLASASGETVSMSKTSGWRSLWNDLFSQVFRATRSILNGFIAFFTACNRHRLSIYNHMEKLIHQSADQGSFHDDVRHRWESRTSKERRKSL